MTLVKTASSVFLVRVMGAALLFFYNVYLARMLTISDFGDISFIMAFISMTMIITVSGSKVFLTKEIARVENTDITKKCHIYYTGIVNVLLFVPVAVLVVYTVLNFRQDGSNLFVFGAALLLFTSIKIINDGYLIGDSKSIVVSFLDNIVRPALLLIIIFVLDINAVLSRDSVLTVIVSTFVVIVLFQTFIIKPKLPVLLPKISDLKRWNVLSFPFFIISFSMIMQNNTSIFLLGILSTNENVAYYAVSTKMSALIVFAIAASNQVYMPVISNLYKQRDFNLINLHISQISRLVGVAGLLMGIALIVASENLLLLFGEKYVSALDVFIILIFATIISAISGPVGTIMSMTDNASESASVMLQAALLGFVLNLILIPFLNAKGAAIATVLALAYWNLTLIYRVKRKLNIRSGLIGLVIFRKE